MEINSVNPRDGADSSLHPLGLSKEQTTVATGLTKTRRMDLFASRPE
ncbi:MAG: hypothetical protein QXJ69_07525 [Desulfurococcaceae archaeon]